MGPVGASGMGGVSATLAEVVARFDVQAADLDSARRASQTATRRADQERVEHQGDAADEQLAGELLGASAGVVEGVIGITGGAAGVSGSGSESESADPSRGNWSKQAPGYARAAGSTGAVGSAIFRHRASSEQRAAERGQGQADAARAAEDRISDARGRVLALSDRIMDRAASLEDATHRARLAAIRG